jgi:hypothetical protein
LERLDSDSLTERELPFSLREKVAEGPDEGLAVLDMADELAALS